MTETKELENWQGMTLSEAIEINESLLDGTYDHRIEKIVKIFDEDVENGIKMGIEAMKQARGERRGVEGRHSEKNIKEGI